MIKVVMDLLGSLFIVIMDLYIMLNSLNKKMTWNNYSIYIALITGIGLNILNRTYNTDFMRIIFTTLISFVMVQMVNRDKKSLAKNFLAAVFAQFIFIVSEIIFLAIIVLITGINAETFVSSFVGAVITNIVVTIIAFVLYSMRFIKQIYSKFLSSSKNITTKKMIIIILISIILINLLLASVYYQVSLIILIFINSIFVTFIMMIIYKLLDEKNKLLIQTNKTLQYKAENDALINNLNEYEKLADQHRILNHENKNQLSAIKQMVTNNDDTVLEYIDNLLKTKIPDDESLLSKTKRIPSGGLQGIIYKKMLLMKKEEIKCTLNISRELKNLDFKKLGIDTNVELCKIIGVFIDNSIDEVRELKEKIIDIELYAEQDKFCIGVTNTFGKHKDFSKLDEVGYTSKGDGHGYGLSLVRDIISNNKRFENTRLVTGKYFTQVIKVSDMGEEIEDTSKKVEKRTKKSNKSKRQKKK